MNCPVIYDAQTKVWSNPIKVLLPKMSLGQCILQKLDEKDPNKIIEVNYDNGEKLTATQLKTVLISVAQNLLNLGIKKGDVVLFFSGFNSLTTPIVSACYVIGAVICPIELNFGDDDADYIIGKVNPSVILYDPIYKSRVESIIKRINLLNLKYVLSFEPCNGGDSVPEMLCKPYKSTDDFVAPDLGDPDIVVGGLILTSGTTGKPKVVCLSHSQIRYGMNCYRETSENLINLYICSQFRWITPVIYMLLPIFENCSRVFSGQIATPELCVSIIRKYEVTHFFTVDGLITKIFQYAKEKQFGDYFKTICCVASGGERISKVTHELVRYLTPDAFFLKAYGMTELAGCIASNESLPNNINCGSGYIKDGLCLKIIDDNNKPLGPNQNGQICVKTISPYLKYLNNDKANTESYTNDGEWFLTGDYGKFDDQNFLHVFNRCKDLIKCGQHVVIPATLEKHIEDYEAVKVSYVIGIPDDNKGEIPVALIKLNSNVSISAKSKKDLKDDINNFLKSILPSDELPPKEIYFVDNFPYTLCGKVDKMKLKQFLIDNLIN